MYKYIDIKNVTLTILGNQIKLRENSTMNYQLLNEMIVVVTVQDPSGATVTSNLTINVNNVNEPPQFSSPVYYGEVKDGTVKFNLRCTI